MRYLALAAVLVLGPAAPACASSGDMAVIAAGHAPDLYYGVGSVMKKRKRTWAPGSTLPSSKPSTLRRQADRNLAEGPLGSPRNLPYCFWVRIIIWTWGSLARAGRRWETFSLER